jgi:hypothetical protein
MQKILKERLASVAAIGQEIGLDLGNQMITDYVTQNPANTYAFEVGRNVIDQILAQPGCVGLKFYEAYNEQGEKTLVYTGLDQAGKAILEVSVVDSNGSLTTKPGIVADRIKPVVNKPGGVADADGWEWTIE